MTRGGPVILVQVENEYGSFGKDKEYLNAIRKMITGAGIDVTLYTADGSEDDDACRRHPPRSPVGDQLRRRAPEGVRQLREVPHRRAEDVRRVLGGLVRSLGRAAPQGRQRRPPGGHRLDARAQHLVQPLHGARRHVVGLHEWRELRYRRQGLRADHHQLRLRFADRRSGPPGAEVRALSRCHRASISRPARNCPSRPLRCP